jgi:hypothetical protein
MHGVPMSSYDTRVGALSDEGRVVVSGTLAAPVILKMTLARYCLELAP